MAHYSWSDDLSRQNFLWKFLYSLNGRLCGEFSGNNRRWRHKTAILWFFKQPWIWSSRRHCSEHQNRPKRVVDIPPFAFDHKKLVKTGGEKNNFDREKCLAIFFVANSFSREIMIFLVKHAFVFWKTAKIGIFVDKNINAKKCIFEIHQGHFTVK